MNPKEQTPAENPRGEGEAGQDDPGERHSGEGLASMRSRLARTLADANLLKPPLPGTEQEGETQAPPAEFDPQSDGPKPRLPRS